MEDGVKPVDVIAVCTADGQIRPLRVQLVDEERQLVRLQIEQILSTEDIRHVGAEAKIFLCRATMWERKWVFQLKYTIRTHSWCILRRIC